MRNDYYVYAYLREDGTPYYVGKGCGRRAFRDEGKNATKPPRERIAFWKENLTEEVALDIERYYIWFYGRQCDGGILRNISEGGENPPINKGHSEETKRKIRETNKRRVAEGRDFSYLKGHKKTITEKLLRGKKEGVKKCKRGPDGRFTKKG